MQNAKLKMQNDDPQFCIFNSTFAACRMKPKRAETRQLELFLPQFGVAANRSLLLSGEEGASHDVLPA